MGSFINVQVNDMIIVALLLFSAMVSCVLAVYIFTKSRSGKVMMFFLCGQILTIVWTVFYVFELLAPTVKTRWIIVCFEYLSLCYVGFVFLHFAYAYTRHEMMSRKWFYITLILPTFNYIAVWTNPLHHYFYYDFHLNGEVFGPITYLIIVTTLSYLLIGAFFFLSKEHTQTSSKQKQSMYFIIAILIPVIVHISHTIGVVNFGFSITLIFVPFSVLLFIVSVLKYQFLDVLPIAINDTIDGMLDGILVIHVKGKIIDYNIPFFKTIFGLHNFKGIETMNDFLGRIKTNIIDENQLEDFLESLDENFTEIVKGNFSVTSVLNETVIVYYTSKPILDYSNCKIATLVTFYDMTDIYELYEQLEDKNSELTDANLRLETHFKTVHQLTMETERNKIMADVHDTLGHSMMELLALLEVTDLKLEYNKEDIQEIVEEAIDKGRDALSEVRSAVSKYKKMGGMT